jgi:hypothetical protein
MGCDQRAGMSDLVLRDGRYGSLEFVKDSAGHDRVAVLKKKIANAPAL